MPCRPLLSFTFLRYFNLQPLKVPTISDSLELRCFICLSVLYLTKSWVLTSSNLIAFEIASVLCKQCIIRQSGTVYYYIVVLRDVLQILQFTVVMRHNNLLIQPWPSSFWPAHRMGIYSNPLINGLIQHTFKIDFVFVEKFSVIP